MEVAFDFILSCVNFKLLFIIISGRLYPDYFQLLNKNIKFVRCLPISIIFTSHRIKNIFISQKSQYYLSDEVLKSINNPFYNLGGVCSDFESCVNFIFNLYILLRNRFLLSKNEESKSSYDGCLTFECVSSKNQLIFPFIYSELVSGKEVSFNEIKIFGNFLLMNHREDEIVDLILPLLYIKDIPHEIVSKYFLRAYTEETSFCYEMNKLLMKQAGKYYQTFIKVLFEGLLNQSLFISEDNYLYRGSTMSKIESDTIMKLFKEWKEKSDKSYPSFLLYSRCFLSFSKDENAIIKFIGKTDEKKYGIVFILKNNFNIENKYTSNADIEFISAYRHEREVLFFPFSSFCLENITKGNFKGKNCIIINLEYLGKYKNIFEEIKKDENFKNNFINTFNNQNFAKEVIKSNMISLSDETSNKKKQIFEKIKNKIKEEYKIEIKDEIKEEKNQRKKCLLLMSMKK